MKNDLENEVNKKKDKKLWYHHGIRTHDLCHKAGAPFPLGYGGSRWYRSEGAI